MIDEKSLLRTHASNPAAPSPGKWVAYRLHSGALLGLWLVLSLCFIRPLIAWGQLAMASDLFSHIVIIPLISGYLIWQDRERLPERPSADPLLAVPLVLLAAGLLSWVFSAERGGRVLAPNDYLSLTIGAWTCLVWASALAVMGRRVLRAVAFPALFLVFVIPFPTAVVDMLEVFFQYTSAEVAAWLISVAGLPNLREGLVFNLPGITLRVAQECSGIHSSLVLFITALLGGHLFLRAPWRRAVLALAVIPLGILRNGVRILTIALLCVHVDTSMVDSAIHRRGGPIFFVASLIPFGLLLLWLRRSERQPKAKGQRPANPAPRAGL